MDLFYKIFICLANLHLFHRLNKFQNLLNDTKSCKIQISYFNLIFMLFLKALLK